MIKNDICVNLVKILCATLSLDSTLTGNKSVHRAKHRGEGLEVGGRLGLEIGSRLGLVVGSRLGLEIGSRLGLVVGAG